MSGQVTLDPLHAPGDSNLNFPLLLAPNDRPYSL